MSGVVRHRVVSPILSTNKVGFVTIPAGSIIESSGDLLEPGLHAVTLDGQELFAFARDLEERTQLIDQTMVSNPAGTGQKS